MIHKEACDSGKELGSGRTEGLIQPPRVTLGISHHSSMLGFLNYAMKLPSMSGKLSESMGEPRSNSQESDNRFFLGPTPLVSAATAKLIPPTANDPDDPDTLRPAHPCAGQSWDVALGKRIAF